MNEEKTMESSPLNPFGNITFDSKSKKKLNFMAKFFMSEALLDYFAGLLNWPMWVHMAVADLRRRYRRTLIGPFWTTLSLGIFILTMGILFSTLWKVKIDTFLPYFSTGFICWTFTSSIIMESCGTFTAAEGLLKQMALPYSSFAWLVVARNFLVFLHQLPIYIIIALVFHISFTKYTLLLIPALLLFFFTANWLAILLGFFCARFRDMQQVVGSLLQISMFVTPIFWPEAQLGGGLKSYLVINGNPIYHYISIIRQPLLGHPPSLLNWSIVCLITVVGWFFTMIMMTRKHSKLIFWI